MEPERARDGFLASGVLAMLVSTLRLNGDLAALRDRWAAGVGVATALLTEWVFLTYPAPLLSWWERPAVNRGSALGLLGGAVLARRRPRLLAVATWGLVTYLVLLGGLLLRRPGDEQDADGRQPDG